MHACPLLAPASCSSPGASRSPHTAPRLLPSAPPLGLPIPGMRTHRPFRGEGSVCMRCPHPFKLHSRTTGQTTMPPCRRGLLRSLCGEAAAAGACGLAAAAAARGPQPRETLLHVLAGQPVENDARECPLHQRPCSTEYSAEQRGAAQCSAGSAGPKVIRGREGLGHGMRAWRKNTVLCVGCACRRGVSLGARRQSAWHGVSPAASGLLSMRPDCMHADVNATAGCGACMDGGLSAQRQRRHPILSSSLLQAGWMLMLAPAMGAPPPYPQPLPT